ncbi:MAG: AAA family ATPase [Bdellovibrionales bacterium]|nr:AAA family ATPase [Bdellovibrionales bacterium]
MNAESSGPENPLSDWSLDPFARSTIPSARRVREIWAIGGGKGGVGKSLISSSLSMALARLNQKVIAIDLDLGGANLHTTLGVDFPQLSLGDFISGRTENLKDCVISTGNPNLSIISGAQDAVNAAQLSSSQKTRLFDAFHQLDADYLIFDLGAGTGVHTIDFFLHADVGIITMLPEPTSIENAYRFIKSAYFRKLRTCPQLESVYPLIELAMDGKNGKGIKTPSDLFREVNAANPEAGLRLREQIARFQPKLILNQIRAQTDVEVGLSVKSVSKRYFGIDIDYIGYLEYETNVWQAIRRKKPFMVEFPDSRIAASIDRITNYLYRKGSAIKPSAL